MGIRKCGIGHGWRAICASVRADGFPERIGLLATRRERKSLVFCPEGRNRYHAILEMTGRPFLVESFESAQALIALGGALHLEGTAADAK